MKQNDAVVQAVLNITGHEAYSETPCVLTSEQKAQVREVLFEGFKTQKIVLSPEKSAEGEQAIWEYIPGLISNHMKKDKRLNGNVKFEVKNPGSRAGNSDPQLTAMRALLGSLTDADERTEVQGYIDARLAEINAAKVVKVIDFAALPAELSKFKK